MFRSGSRSAIGTPSDSGPGSCKSQRACRVGRTFLASQSQNDPKIAENGEIGTTCEPAADLDRLVEALTETVGRQARRRAVDAIRRS